MTENTIKTERNIPVLQILYKRMILIILITVLCTLVGLLYSALTVKPVYTARTSVVLKLEVDNPGISANTNNIKLAKQYFPTVKEIILSPKVTNAATENYGAGIKVSKITIGFKEESMIFSIAYSEMSPKEAEGKLLALISTATEYLQQDGVIQSKSVDLVPVQNKVDISVTNNFTSNIVIGFAIGLVASIAIAFVLYFMDNTLKEKEDVESILKADVIAHIENE